MTTLPSYLTVRAHVASEDGTARRRVLGVGLTRV